MKEITVCSDESQATLQLCGAESIGCTFPSYVEVQFEKKNIY